MAREYDVSVDGIDGLTHGFVLQWSGSIGFGEYTVYVDDDGKLRGDSECMDSADDKSFLKCLLCDLLKKIEV